MTIYLDSNATTRPDASVVEAVERAVREAWANPSSIHRPGQEARRVIELARASLARLIGVRPRHITLTGSGTESIDLAIRGAFLAAGRIGAKRTREPGAIITHKAEHIGVRDLAAALEKHEGVRVLWAGFDAEGVVDPASVERLLSENADVFLVSVQWANNETGAVQPVGRISELCRAHGALFHCDATQWVGKMVTEIEGTEAQRHRGTEGRRGKEVGIKGSGEQGIKAPRHRGIEAGSGAQNLDPLMPRCLDAFDLLTYSAHKFHGPKGVGVLYCRAGVRTAPLIHGEQEQGRRGGTENVPGIAGAGAAAEAAMEWLARPEGRRRVAGLRDRFEKGVLAGYPEASVNGPVERPGEEPGTRRLWNTSSIAFPRLEAEALLLLLSERGVCASAGAACSSGSLEPSPVLRAMGIPAERAHGSVRFSLSRETTDAEIDAAVPIVIACAERLRKSMSAVM